MPNKISAHNVGLSFGLLENIRVVVYTNDFFSGFVRKVYTANTTPDIAWAI
jgi:hypothetical protein